MKGSGLTCAWCDRPDAGYRLLMSKEHPVCDVCFCIWYDGTASPEDLRAQSLGEEGKKWLAAEQKR